MTLERSLRLNLPRLIKTGIEYYLLSLAIKIARKEFFRTDIKEIEQIAKEINPSAEFYINPEAKEFRESESLRKH